MEGRVPPAAADANDDPPLSLCLPPPPSSSSSETYIVQIPRDQIYRVPPPENAKIVESYRNPDHKQEKYCGGKRSLWILLTLVVLAAIVGTIIGVNHMFFSPKAPEFSITKVLLITTPPPQTSHKEHETPPTPTYEISLKADNPNGRMGVSYENGGETSLSFEHKKIAGGKYTSLYQEAKESDIVHLTLDSSDGTLPSQVEKNMEETKTNTPVALSLTINVPIKLKGMVSWSKDMKVICDFKVSTLASGTHLSSQNCETKV
ncbi:Methyltransferase PMT10 [Actinidia chinensis var. chinensis]|uniref:Methyltransferase PMT10 n=1 Tax=Actinidia chinensis var. chinensis TaxID=1590841 RepID=A0A2R6PAQ2_ACTCC|nr:Methyltransferase PMT10 [Actinidia chinensis var. chinensis]